jgi:hypothetical protein
MGTPNRKLILNNLQSTFEGITVANGYKTTITKVQALARGFADVKSGERPFIGYVPQAEQVEHFPFDLLRCTLNISIIGHVSGSSQADRSTKLNNLIDDITAAFYEDPTRGTNAITSRLGQIETDEGDPDGKGDGSVLMQAVIIYQRNTNKS